MQQSYQFTAEDADIVLRTPEPEPKLFRVHKNILSIASSVFRGMLAVPQSPPESTEGNIPIVDVHDSAQDLEVLLRMIYPVAFPPITDLNALSAALLILDKYHTEGLQERLKPLLTSPSFLHTDSMRVYAIACRWGFKTEANMAAPYVSAVGISSFTCLDDMSYISGLDYHRIALLIQERKEAGRSEILNKPLDCVRCPGRFYDEFRRRLVERLFVGNQMFQDLGTCIDVCFDIVKEMDSSYGWPICSGERYHLEDFVFSLAKSLQSLPASKNAGA